MSEDETEEEYEQNSTETMMNQTKVYIQQVLAMAEHIKNAKEQEDRLGIASELTYCLNAMMISIKGWGSWLNSVLTLSTMSKEDLETSYKGIKQIAIDFLNIDAKITEKKLVEAKVQMDKLVKKTKSHESAKKPYVT